LRRLLSRRPSPSMVVALIALFVSLGGVSFGAAVVITGKAIKNNTVGSKDLKNNDIRGTDIRNNSLTGKDVKESRLGKVPNAAHADSADSADNADNATRLGGNASNTFMRFGGTIPSGVTVTGNWYAAPSNGNATVGFAEVSLPALAPADIESANSNMGAGTTGGTDNDATCTGTATAPTAPAGKICFYVGFQTGVNGLAAYSSNGPHNRGAAVSVTGTSAAANSYARGGWAYTAP
jgi:hypothetical protein